LGLGSVLAMPFSGGLAGRFGCRRTIVCAGTIACIALPVMACANSTFVLGAGLLFFGGGIGMMDVVMNVQAVIVEKASGRAMMSGFHGLYSVGGIVGAGAMTGLLWLGLSPRDAALLIAGIGVALLFGCAKGLLPYGSEEESPAFAVPRGRVLLIGSMCFVMFMAEGSVLDWSGVLLNAVRGLEKSKTGVGYVAFSITMTIGRLTGDAIVGALGPLRVLVLGGLCAASGFGLAALAPAWPVTILGFALVGVGASNCVPVLFSAAGRQTAMPSNLAIAAISTMGYAGILTGPALIGFVARGSSLPAALMIVTTALVGVSLGAKRALSVTS